MVEWQNLGKWSKKLSRQISIIVPFFLGYVNFINNKYSDDKKIINVLFYYKLISTFHRISDVQISFETIRTAALSKFLIQLVHIMLSIYLMSIQLVYQWVCSQE